MKGESRTEAKAELMRPKGRIKAKDGKQSRIFLSSPHMSGDEQKYIREAFKENWVAPLGPNVDEFEKELAKYCGVKHAAVLSSGSAAIHLALIMLDVGPGDYVICQSFTFGATVFPVKYQGATPVLVDSEEETWNMGPELLEDAIIDCMEGNVASYGVRGAGYEDKRLKDKDKSSVPKKPKAIIPVHLYGMPYDVEGIHGVAEKYGIPVIEDAAEALGSRYFKAKGERRKAKGESGKSKGGVGMAGSFGKMGALSFNGNKIITTSGGGALLSDDEELIKRARFLATQARDNAPHYQHSEIGYNYRMSNILAGIGRGQLEVIEDRVKRRREIYDWYKKHLSHIDGLTFGPEPQPATRNPQHATPKYFSNRWLTTILIDSSKTGFTPIDLRLAMEKENIESRPLWKPMHMQPVFEDCPAYVNGVSEKLFNTGLCLPSGSNMTEEDLVRVRDVIVNNKAKGEWRK